MTKNRSLKRNREENAGTLPPEIRAGHSPAQNGEGPARRWHLGGLSVPAAENAGRV